MTTDPSDIGGWPSPVYTWGFTDVDPGGPLSYDIGTDSYLNTQLVPAGALTAAGGKVGNAKFPSPIIEAGAGDDVYITVHNRGFYQDRQAVQDEHTLHLHGIHAQAVYDGFPESAGSYSEVMAMFWRSPNYGGDSIINDGTGTTTLKELNNLAFAYPSAAYPLNAMATKMKDDWWNNMDAVSQQRWLSLNASTIPNVVNALSGAGGIMSQFDPSLALLTPAEKEAHTEYTYYFRAVTPGSTMYHCHVIASEHVQMGMYGALIIRPMDYIQKDMNHPLTWNATSLGKYFDINYNGQTDAGEPYYTDTDGDNIISIGDVRQEELILKPGPNPGDQTYTYAAGSVVTVYKTVYGVGTNSVYDIEYIFLLSEIDPIWHQIIERGKGSFYPPNWKPQLWFVNGRTFPETVFSFQYHNLEPNPASYGNMWFKAEPRYNTWMSAQQGDRVLERWIGMGYQEHSMHQHGWHMELVGTDMEQYTDSTGNPYRLVKFTLPISSGETYDTITNVDPVYGEGGYAAGSPISVTNGSGGNNLKWRAVYPIHDHYDYQVTTNGIYPGGALILFEAAVVNAQSPLTWANPYNGDAIETLPDAPPRPTGPYGY